MKSCCALCTYCKLTTPRTTPQRVTCSEHVWPGTLMLDHPFVQVERDCAAYDGEVEDES